MMKTNFLHILLLTDWQFLVLCKAFVNNSSTNKTLWKNQLPKTVQLGGFLVRLLGPLLKTALSVIKNVLKPLAKSILIPWRLTAAASAVDSVIHKKIIIPGTTALIISNEGIDDIIKIVKSLEESELLIKLLSKTIKNEAKEQKGRFLSMLLSLVGDNLLEDLLAGKRVIRAAQGAIREEQYF